MISLTQLSIVITFSLILRTSVSMWGHSGMRKPPMFGDFEAQRHWMELTVNLPAEEWYVDSPNNDLQYWGLDYPPMTAYHMMINGKVAQCVNSSIVELHTSRGIETPQVKFFMRFSVILMDALIFIPSAIALFTLQKRMKGEEDKDLRIMKNIMILVLYPGLILIDNGHFQYNSVSLGLVVLATCCLTHGWDLLAAFLFCVSLNYKQMELYHALPFFGYLLGSCLRQQGLGRCFLKLASLALVVVLTFVAIWSPFLHSVDSAVAVVQRLFPLKRGLYEDKVANFWCAASIIIKFKELFSQNIMAIICLLTTAVCLLPSFIHLIINPTIRNFKFSLINSSFIFFLFSFHVHEKTILLAAIPACMVVEEHPFAVIWFLLISVFSMLPLLVKDGLLIPAVATSALFWMMANLQFKLNSTVSQTVRLMFQMSMLGAVGLSLCHLFVKPPDRYPDLYTLFIAIYSCAHFILLTFYFHVQQMYSKEIVTLEDRKRK